MSPVYSIKHTFQKVDIWWEGSEQIQNVVTTVVANYSLALDRRTQFDLLVLLIYHMMWQDFQLLTSLVQLCTQR